MKRANTWLLAIALLAGSLACTPVIAADRYQPNVSTTQEQQLERARALRREHKLAAAIPLFQSLLRDNPDYYLASYNLALAHADTRDYDAAIVQFSHAASLQKKYQINDPTLFNSLGWTQLLTGNYAAAEDAFNKAESQFDSLNTESRRRLLNNIGVLHQYKKDYEKSEKYFKRAADEYSSSLARENLRAVQALKQEQTDANWFPVIASVYKADKVSARLTEFKGKSPPYELHVYQATDIKGTPVYALSLGGYLAKEEASKRSKFARDNNIAKDAYIWSSNAWGKNVASTFTR